MKKEKTSVSTSNVRRVERTGESQFSLIVQLESGHHEKWLYEREEFTSRDGTHVSYLMIGREDSK